MAVQRDKFSGREVTILAGSPHRVATGQFPSTVMTLKKLFGAPCLLPLVVKYFDLTKTQVFGLCRS
jgi:hypothetical protein